MWEHGKWKPERKLNEKLFLPQVTEEQKSDSKSKG